MANNVSHNETKIYRNIRIGNKNVKCTLQFVHYCSVLNKKKKQTINIKTR